MELPEGYRRFERRFVWAVARCLRRAATFSGRAGRAEYWLFFLFCLLADLWLNALGHTLGGRAGGLGLSLAFDLAVLVPALAVLWRRMHDIGRPGWHAFVPQLLMLPLWPAIVLAEAGWSLAGWGLSVGVVGFCTGVVLWLRWATRPGMTGPNRYGPPPNGPPE